MGGGGVEWGVESLVMVVVWVVGWVCWRGYSAGMVRVAQLEAVNPSDFIDETGRISVSNDWAMTMRDDVEFEKPSYCS